MNKEFEWTGHAMGTEYAIAIVCPEAAQAEALSLVARADIEAAEARFSRFLADSELSILNRTKSQIVSQAFFDATAKAYELYQKTDGYFNPLLQIARHGYTENFADMKKDDRSANVLPYNIDFSKVEMDPKTLRITLKADQALDYGGFLKGYIAQVIADHIHKENPEVSGVVINIGGDICARGVDANGDPFVFAIYNPHTGTSDIEVILDNKSLATSGTYKRNWKRDGKKIHHILDKTGLHNPASDIVSVSIVHADGALAEAYTKEVLSLSDSEAESFAERTEIGLVMIDRNGTVKKYLS